MCNLELLKFKPQKGFNYADSGRLNPVLVYIIPRSTPKSAKKGFNCADSGKLNPFLVYITPRNTPKSAKKGI